MKNQFKRKEDQLLQQHAVNYVYVHAERQGASTTRKLFSVGRNTLQNIMFE